MVRRDGILVGMVLPRFVMPALGLLAAPLAAQAPGDAALGLANRWFTAGGSASRSGATATEALGERPEFAWEYQPPGRLVGEPLVWDDVIVVEIELPKNRRRLQVLALSDGQPIVHRDFRGKQAKRMLLPALWHNEVVLRVGDKLKRFRFGTGGVSEQRASQAMPGLGGPLRVGDEVYVIVGGAIERLDVGRLERRWRSGSTGFVGHIAVAGDVVYGIRATRDGGEVVMLRRATGRRKGATAIPLPVAGSAPEIVLGGSNLIVRELPTIMLTDGSTADSLGYPLPLPMNAQPRLATMRSVPAAAGDIWVGACGSKQAPMLGIGRKGTDQVAVLATDKAHRHLLSQPVTLAGPLAYLGGTAVDLETFEVRWRIEAPAGARAIPARDALLFGTATSIVAFRRRGAEAGAVRRAREIGWDAAIAAASEAQLRGIVADAMLGLELSLVDELLDRCRALGVDEKWVAAQAKARFSKRRLQPKRDAVRLAALQRRAAAVDAAALASLWGQLAAAGDAAAARLHGLRYVLGRDAAHAGAIAAVRELVPAALRPPGEFQAREWLGFLEHTRTIPVGFLPVPKEAEIGTAQPDQLKLLEYRAGWRQDLLAVTSPRLCVYTPVAAPGSLARCLSLGELVCDTLEGMFAAYPALRQDPRRMRIQLFPNAAEYKRYSPGGGHLAWTAGHYSPLEELSRMFLPDDEQAFARVMPVFVHELTHQWLEDRCPAIAANKIARRRQDLPAYWIVEGFASFVEEFAFDLELRTHRTDNQRDENLDILAHTRKLLPWETLLRASAVDFHRISPVPRYRVLLGYRLGVERQLSPRNLFYAQAGALCHWLWHTADGKHRRVLIEFVRAYYQGESDQLDLAQILGMTPAAIGKAVQDHALARKPKGG